MANRGRERGGMMVTNHRRFLQVAGALLATLGLRKTPAVKAAAEQEMLPVRLGNATSKWAELTVGTAGQVLVTDGTPRWADDAPWISVEERLPAVGVYVELRESGNVAEGYFSGSDEGAFFVEDRDGKDVTHWRQSLSY